ncbi:MAG: DUF2911 domain-containing protein [Acidobacteria bacterium]|nr:DUF2911 domain-containing protein [Acidobacteriota bacterium]
MRKMVNLLVIAAVVCMLSAMTVFGKDKSEYITLPQDVVINGTLVKKGEYKLKFDEKSGELLLMKGSKVVAKTSAKMEKREEKASRMEFNTTTNGTQNELRGISFRGESHKLVLSQSAASGQPATAQ